MTSHRSLALNPDLRSLELNPDLRSLALNPDLRSLALNPDLHSLALNPDLRSLAATEAKLTAASDLCHCATRAGVRFNANLRTLPQSTEN